MKYFYLFCALLLTNSTYSMNEIISIDSIVTNLNAAIENKDAAKANYWHNCLHILAGTDWSFFNHNQRTQYANFYLPLYPKLFAINQEVKESVDEAINKDKKEKEIITAALIEKLNQDKCTINWTNVLGSNIETPHSPEELKQLRIKTLEESHIPKLMQ